MNSSVSQILADKYGISTRPGGKTDCPFCHKKTFSVKKDDALGKCFHPHCGRFITPYREQDEHEPSVYRVLEDIYHDFHRELLRQKETKTMRTHSAYSYVVKERGIHPQVVADSMLGAVPNRYETDSKFAPLISKAETAVKAEEKAQEHRRGRQKKSAGPTAQDHLDFIINTWEKLKKCISGCAGWLCFFYTDSTHRIVAIRLRRPYSKDIRYFKPFKTAGLFGHGVFTPYESEEWKWLNDQLMVTEGEFNQLQLQSLSVRVAEAKGLRPETGYVFACAVGGVANTDCETIHKIARHPVICYDNDTNGTGFALVEKARQQMSVTAFTTPEPDSDLDSVIRSFGNDCRGAWEAIQGLVRERKLFPQPLATVRSEIDGVRRLEGRSGGLKRFEMRRRVGEIIVADLKGRGRFFHDSTRAYVFLDEEKHLLAIEQDDQDLELLLSHYGIVPSDDLHKFVLDTLRLEGLEHGEHKDVHLFSHCNLKTGTVYLYNFDNQIHRITADNMDLVDNGTDGVLFLHNPKWKPFKLGASNPSSSALHEVLLSKLHFRDGELTTGEQRLLVLIWFYSLLFPELFPTRPILALIGEAGSGKTFALRMIGQLLFGPSFQVTQVSSDPKDFDAAVSHAPFVALDNADSKVSWLDDSLAVAATGGSIKRRELYTTNRLVEYPVRAFLGITCRTPHFRREDVADRLLPFQVERFEAFIPESELLAELQDKRDAVFTEIVAHIQEFLGALRNQKGETYPTRFRMADFANFALKLTHALGCSESMMSILDRLAGEQSLFALEGEPIVELLELWLAEGGGKNIGGWITTRELCDELAELADRNGIKFWYAGKTRSFAQRLRNIMNSLRQFYHIEEKTGRGRRRLLSFRPKTAQGEAAQRAREEVLANGS